MRARRVENAPAIASLTTLRANALGTVIAHGALLLLPFALFLSHPTFYFWMELADPAKEGEPAAAMVTYVTVGRDGGLRVDGESVSKGNSEGAIEHAQMHGLEGIVFDAEDETPFAAVVEAMDVARSAGADRIAASPEPLDHARRKYKLWSSPTNVFSFVCGGVRYGDGLGPSIWVDSQGFLLLFGILLAGTGAGALIRTAHVREENRSRRDSPQRPSSLSVWI